MHISWQPSPSGLVFYVVYWLLFSFIHWMWLYIIFSLDLWYIYLPLVFQPVLSNRVYIGCVILVGYRSWQFFPSVFNLLQLLTQQRTAVTASAISACPRPPICPPSVPAFPVVFPFSPDTSPYAVWIFSRHPGYSLRLVCLVSCSYLRYMVVSLLCSCAPMSRLSFRFSSQLSHGFHLLFTAPMVVPLHLLSSHQAPQRLPRSNHR